MDLVYTFDDNFLPQTAAAAVSVCENNRAAKAICFRFLTLHVSDEDAGRLENMIRSYETEGHRREVCFTRLEEIGSYFDFDIDTTAWNPIVLARLILDRLLPDDVHRILYLDSDTMVRGSLEELFETEMNGCAIGACIEPTCSRERKEALGLHASPYYNAGVLLIDLDAWRKMRTGEEILSYYRENGGRLFANDQDAINGSQKGKIRTLSVTYNYHNTYDIYRYGLLEKNCDYSVPSKEELREIRKSPCIIHFLGEERPWRAGNTHRFRAEYQMYLSKTPWKDTKPEEGWRGYFICWRIFNFLMKPFPMLRLSIINRLIPKMLKKRQG